MRDFLTACGATARSGSPARREGRGVRGSRRLNPGGLERLESRVVLSTIEVMNTNDVGADSLRTAIEQANLDQAADTITFAPGYRG